MILIAKPVVTECIISILIIARVKQVKFKLDFNFSNACSRLEVSMFDVVLNALRLASLPIQNKSK